MDPKALEVRTQKCLELVPIQLFDVERVVEVRLVGVSKSVRAGDHEQATWPQHALDLDHHGFVLGVMLDRLEADHHVDTFVLQGDLRTGSNAEFEVSGAVLPACVTDGFLAALASNTVTSDLAD